ncbi:mitochondrial ribosomal subunit S27-domain-containing protein [Chaetomium sp. MPI-CAGE-AT-0009]|nr:mitochondrial ribosomal subunit S27-domain-containing protein [Chaetomium sp. MPI-CAGE-AT-0009]
MSVPRARLLALMKAQCQLFSTTYNPEGIRTGNKILRQRLRGPALASYYPRKVMSFRDFQDEFRPLELEVEDDDELDRLEHVAALKARGKGTPKKGKDRDKKKK